MNNDLFDRTLGSLHGLPGVCQTKASTIRCVTPVVGDSQTFIVQTIKHPETGSHILIEWVSQAGTVRMVLPPVVSEAINRQRDSLVAKSRSKAAKEKAQARKDRGELPGFMRKKERAG